MSHRDLPFGIPAAAHDGLDDGTSDGGPPQGEDDGTADAFGDLVEPTYEGAPSGGEASSTGSPMTPAEVAWRDAEVRKCVKSRMTGKQIYAFSQSWPRPFPHVNHLWRRLGRLKLKAIEEREQLPHKRAIVEVLLRVADCCKRQGYRLTRWQMEFSLGGGAGVRVDLETVIEGKGLRRVRYWEVQRTWKQAYLWRRKCERLKRYRKQKGVPPFRVLFIVEDIDATESYKYHAVNTVYKIACDVMKDSPAMCLFLIDWFPDFRVQYDVLEEDIYMSNQKKREPLI